MKKFDIDKCIIVNEKCGDFHTVDYKDAPAEVKQAYDAYNPDSDYGVGVDVVVNDLLYTIR